LHCVEIIVNPVTHSCLLSSTAESDFIDSKSKETEKRIGSRIFLNGNKSRQRSDNSTTWSLMY